MINNQRKLRRSIRNNKKRNFLIDVVLFSLNFTQNPTAANPKIKTESTKLQIQRLQQQIQKDQIQIQSLKSGLKNDPESNTDKDCPDYLKIDNCVNNDLTFIKCSWQIDQLSQSCTEKNNYRLYFQKGSDNIRASHLCEIGSIEELITTEGSDFISAERAQYYRENDNNVNTNNTLSNCFLGSYDASNIGATYSFYVGKFVDDSVISAPADARLVYEYSENDIRITMPPTGISAAPVKNEENSNENAVDLLLSWNAPGTISMSLAFVRLNFQMRYRLSSENAGDWIFSDETMDESILLPQLFKGKQYDFQVRTQYANSIDAGYDADENDNDNHWSEFSKTFSYSIPKIISEQDFISTSDLSKDYNNNLNFDYYSDILDLNNEIEDKIPLKMVILFCTAAILSGMIIICCAYCLINRKRIKRYAIDDVPHAAIRVRLGQDDRGISKLMQENKNKMMGGKRTDFRDRSEFLPIINANPTRVSVNNSVNNLDHCWDQVTVPLVASHHIDRKKLLKHEEMLQKKYSSPITNTMSLTGPIVVTQEDQENKIGDLESQKQNLTPTRNTITNISVSNQENLETYSNASGYPAIHSSVSIKSSNGYVQEEFRGYQSESKTSTGSKIQEDQSSEFDYGPTTIARPVEIEIEPDSQHQTSIFRMERKEPLSPEVIRTALEDLLRLNESDFTKNRPKNFDVINKLHHLSSFKSTKNYKKENLTVTSSNEVNLGSRENMLSDSNSLNSVGLTTSSNNSEKIEILQDFRSRIDSLNQSQSQNHNNHDLDHNRRTRIFNQKQASFSSISESCSSNEELDVITDLPQIKIEPKNKFCTLSPTKLILSPITNRSRRSSGIQSSSSGYIKNEDAVSNDFESNEISGTDSNTSSSQSSLNSIEKGEGEKSKNSNLILRRSSLLTSSTSTTSSQNGPHDSISNLRRHSEPRSATTSLGNFTSLDSGYFNENFLRQVSNSKTQRLNFSQIQLQVSSNSHSSSSPTTRNSQNRNNTSSKLSSYTRKSKSNSNKTNSENGSSDILSNYSNSSDDEIRNVNGQNLISSGRSNFSGMSALDSSRNSNINNENSNITSSEYVFV